MLAELREHGERLARDAPRPRRRRRSPTTAAYEAAIATLVRGPRGVPADLHARASRSSSTSPTARTRTRAPPTTPSAAPARTCSRASSSCTARELSFNNLNDLNGGAARSCASSRVPACVIVKHANPCGVAVGADDRGGVRARARRRPGLGVRRRRRAQPRRQRGARRADRGAVRRGAVRARLRRGRARGARPEAGDADPQRPRAAHGRRRPSATTSACSAACSSRTATGTSPTARGWRSSPASPTEAQWGDLLFAWRVCKHVASNAIVIAQGPADDRDRRRPDEPGRRGADRGREGAASTATPSRARRSPPTRSSPSRTARGSRSRPGVTALIQPGGSKRDDEVVAAVESAGAAMVFTGRRHFPPLSCEAAGSAVADPAARGDP